MCTNKKPESKFLESDQPVSRGQVAATSGTDTLKAETLYKALALCRGLAQQIFEAQHALNDKLIDHPSLGGEKKGDEPDRAESPHHIPNWIDKTRDITNVLEAANLLQQRLLSHL